MLCPHCSTSLKYRERSNNTCSSCYKAFAFEPKTHPLLINDDFFKRSVNKLSNTEKFYFTPQQLQFSLSRKKMGYSVGIIGLILAAIASTVFAAVLYFPLGALLFVFWIILLLSVKLFYKSKLILPQTPLEFEDTVLSRWRQIYKQNPAKMVSEYVESIYVDKRINGILFCQDYETAACLNANRTDRQLKLAISSKQQTVIEILRKSEKLPVFVLHDASADGIEFLETVNLRFGNLTQVVDIGFRPQSVMKSKLPKFRESATVKFYNNLNKEEIEWLKKGYYTPLFVLRPEKLIKYVTAQIAKKSKLMWTENVEKKAEAVGFMTWVGK